jgi:glycosyltransferase involved in cell wall biosynthesis
VPHRKHAHTDATIPHKLFQYMLASRPVIVSNCRPLARIIRETDAGLVFESGNVSELAIRIAELAANPGLREEMGRRGRAAAATRYNWETEGQKLVALYDKISAS